MQTILRYLLPVLVLLLSGTAYSQSDKPNYGLLWEVTGDQLIDTCYVFGSIHLNDPRAFEFSDSLYHAFMSVDAFAAEVDVDSMSIALLDEFKKGMAPRDTTSGTEQKSTEVQDPNGLPTFLDSYLHQIAVNIGLTTHGLEVFSEHSADYDSIFASSISEDFVFGTPMYEYFVKLYQAGDFDALTEEIANEDMTKSTTMIKRNNKQANSIRKIGRSQSLFATVGAAHLFGEENVLSILRSYGLKVRQVGYGKQSPKLHDLYQISGSHIPTIQDSVDLTASKVQIYSPDKLAKITISGMEAAISTNLGQGLLRIDASLPAIGTLDEDHRQLVSGYLDAPEKLQLIATDTTDNKVMRVYTYESDSLTVAFRVTTSNHVTVMQSSYFYVRSAFKAIPKSLWFNTYTLPNLSYGWNEMDDLKEYGIKYIFPTETSFVKSYQQYSDDTTAGPILVAYKVAVDPETGSEYLLKLQQLPPKYIYNNHPLQMRLAAEAIINNFGYKNVKTQLSTTDDGYVYATVSYSPDNPQLELYLETHIKGNMLFMLLQRSNAEDKNTAFFNSFKIKPIIPSLPVPYTVGESGLTVNVGECLLAIKEDSPQYYFMDSLYMSNQIITVSSMAKYGHYIAEGDLLASYDTLLANQVDTIYHLSKIEIDGKPVGIHAIYRTDSTTLITSEINLIYDEYQVDILSYFADEQGIQLAKDIRTSITIDPKMKIYSDAKDNGKNLLTDLGSKSPDLFSAAKGYIYAIVFDSTHTELLLETFRGTHLDADSTYTAKYQLMSDIPSLNVQDDYYLDVMSAVTSDMEKSRLSEILLSASEISKINIALDYTLSSTTESISEYYFNVFSDSLELFDRYSAQLRRISESGRYQDAVLSNYLAHYDTLRDRNDSYDDDSTWVAEIMKTRIESLVHSLPEDSLYLSDYHVEYLNLEPTSILNTPLVYWLQSSTVLYNKWILLSHLVGNELSVPTELLLELCADDYYYESTLYLLQESDAADLIPEEYRSIERSSIASMKNYFMDEYYVECKNCEVLNYKTVQSKGTDQKLLFVRCQYDQDEEQYLLGLLGPFKGNVLDATEQNSSFYSDSYKLEAEESVKQILIDYYKEED